MENLVIKELEDLKRYCQDYIKLQYGVKNNYIRKTKIQGKNLHIYGHNVKAPIGEYVIQVIIPFYESNDYEYINYLMDHFVLDCGRIREN